MKEIYIRIYSNTRFGYDIIRTKVIKEYKEYGIAIVKYNGSYLLTDIKTGLCCGKRYNKLKDAKSFMDHTEEAKFINWYKLIEHVRITDSYQKKILRVR